MTKIIPCALRITLTPCGTAVLDETKQTVCFADSPFVRRKLEHASVLCADGKEYTIKTIDDHDAGWLMVTLDIPDATVLWDKELESK